MPSSEHHGQSVTLSAVPPVPIVVTNADGTTRSIPVQ